MCTVYNLPNYQDKYFEYKDLTKIHGQPTIDTIAKLLRETRRNAQRVPTALRGGQLGYLALIIEAAYYNVILGAAVFRCPTDPGTFTVTYPIEVGLCH